MFTEEFQDKTHSLIFTKCNLADSQSLQIFTSRLKLDVIMHLDLSHNKLTDNVLPIIQRLCRESSKFSYINLGHNLISLNSSTLLFNLLKSVQTALNLHLNHNDICDSSIELIEKAIIFPQNPPL